MRKLEVVVAFTCLSCIFVVPAVGQYMFLDTDGDGVSSPSDRLEPGGETTVAVYLDTSHDRDGTLRSCNAHAGSGSSGLLDFFSYDLILKVQSKSGAVRWSEFTDGIGFTPNIKDRTSPTELLVTRSGESAISPGRYKLGQVKVTAIAGHPVLTIGTASRLDPGAFTGFGTHCDGSEYPNTYVLGTDWFDAGETSTPVSQTTALSVLQPSQNPFNPNTVITVHLIAAARVRLAIYDVEGRLVRTLIETSNVPAGTRTVAWDGKTGSQRVAASGVYFVQLNVGGSRFLRKATLLK
jgi:hypothetical protein